MGKTRVMSAMEIPTVDEAGLPGLYIQVWWALFAPKGTSKDIVSKLNAEVRVLLADSTTRQRFAELGQDIPAPDQQSTEALAELRDFNSRYVGLGHVIPAIAECPVRPKSGHSANARVCEYAACGAVENKSLEIKTPRPPRVPRC